MAAIYFSDFFGISPDVVEEYGALDISLISDLPLFVDPFLLFNSESPKYQELHERIIDYMRFLKEVTLKEQVPEALLEEWFAFREVKQNWLGFSRSGNRGHGLGLAFAASLHTNFNTVFADFGDEQITQGSHLEKLCLIRNGVGRDTISDFTTNLIKEYLAEYTAEFARRFLSAKQRHSFSVNKVRFNYETRSWTTRAFELPRIGDDFVLLTPKDMLTKDEAWINRPDLMHRFFDIADALPDATLRAQVNAYLRRVLPKTMRPKEEEVQEAFTQVIEAFPIVLDYYIRNREDHGDEAVSVAKRRVHFVEQQFIETVRYFVRTHFEPLGFYRVPTNTYDEARERLMFFKDLIENKGCHRIFYRDDGRPIEREAELQILYRFTWFATPSDISREVNDGRGPADFKASRGSRDKTLIEFKLASNTHLERNLQKQTPIYERASDATHPSLKAIVYFSDEQLERVTKILKKLELDKDKHIVLIDARADNKPSGSVAR